IYSALVSYCVLLFFFLSLRRRPPCSTLFPYTTLFYVDIVSLRRVDVAVFALAVRVCLAGVALRRVVIPVCVIVVAVRVDVVSLRRINVLGEDGFVPVRFVRSRRHNPKGIFQPNFHDLLYNIAVISILRTLLTTEKEL